MDIEEDENQAAGQLGQNLNNAEKEQDVTI